MPNEDVKIKKTEILSDNWYTLKKITFDYKGNDSQWQTQEREAYDRGNGAAILLYNTKRRTVVLTKQFRMPTYINGNDSGMMIEVCAGMLDDANAEERIRKEAEEETGYRLERVEKVFKAYMSPGAVTEILHYFIAEYNADMKISEGGGLAEEQENIEVIELDFDVAYEMIASGAIVDAKTILLLQYAKIQRLV